MRDVLTLPESGIGAHLVGDRTGSAPENGRGAVAAILDAAGEAASVDGAVAGAIARLVAQHGTPAPAAPEADGSLYARAAEVVAQGRVAEALAPLARLAERPASRAEALLGLAVCATRLACYEDALILAEESRRLGPGHPRASCVAGLCELELGNRRAAQGHLATAARLARRDPAYGEDLRLAQRALLLMHLA